MDEGELLMCKHFLGRSEIWRGSDRLSSQHTAGIAMLRPVSAILPGAESSLRVPTIITLSVITNGHSTLDEDGQIAWREISAHELLGNRIVSFHS